MAALLQDFRFALRLILKNRTFAAAAIVVLALGIGANTALFSVVNAVLLQPLPYEHPEQLVQLMHTPPPKAFPGVKTFALAPANYFDWIEQSHVFERATIYAGTGYNISGRDAPESLRGAGVSSQFLSVFGVAPMMGRDFLPEEDQPGHDHVAILSYGLWKDRFASDPNIVNQTMTLNGEPYTVIGVMGPRFRRPEYAQLWTPLALTEKQKAVRGEHHFAAAARLKPGVDVKQAQAELSTISNRLAQQYPQDDKDWGALVLPLRQFLVGDVQKQLLVLFGAVAFVLLIACANVANLMLAKTLTRQKEIAIRTALGASRLRVIQQILSESVVLSLCGAALGLILAHFGVKLIVSYFGQNLPRAYDIALNTQVLVFTALIAIVTGIAAGLMPAIRLTHSNISNTLKIGLGRTDSMGGGRGVRGTLVAAEVALSLMLLVGAGLMLRSLWQLRSVDPGFEADNAFAVNLVTGDKQFTTPTQETTFYTQVLQRVQALPGVQQVGAIDDLPLVGGSNQPVALEGQPLVQLSEQPELQVRVITPGYIQAMGIPLKHGRDLNEQDTADKPPAVLISESVAKRFFSGQDAVGKHLTLSFLPGPGAREIVGIVGDVKQEGLDVREEKPTVYYPLAQDSAVSPAIGGKWQPRDLWLVVRASGSPDTVIPAVKNAVQEMNHDMPLRGLTTLDRFVADSLQQQHVNVLLLGAFAGLALVLAALGIFSVLSYSVRRRVREIGIRMALGAQIRDVLRLIVLEGMKPTLLGIGIGIVGALLLGRLIATMMFGVSATDPLTFAAVAMLLFGVALCACLFPAYRATQVEPVRTLRDE